VVILSELSKKVGFPPQKPWVPFLKLLSGVLPIAIAWLISPFISGIFAMILFLFNRHVRDVAWLRV